MLIQRFFPAIFLFLAQAAHAAEIPPEFKQLPERDISVFCIAQVTRVGNTVFSASETLKEGVADYQITALLNQVWLEHFVESGGTQDLVQKWMPTLSAQTPATALRQYRYCEAAAQHIFLRMPIAKQTELRDAARADTYQRSLKALQSRQK